MKTILATTYAVNPYKGSEDGMGWNFISQIAKNNKVIAITRKNNREAIERFQQETESKIYANMEFHYYDLPYWMRFWKKGERGAMLYFFLWQLFMPVFILTKRIKFDLAHNLNFHTDWIPTFLWVLGKPTVWGPIGHHPRREKSLIAPFYGLKAYWLGEIKWWIKKLNWLFNPLLSLSMMMSKKVIVMSGASDNVLNIPEYKKLVMPSVGTEQPTLDPTIQKSGFKLLMVGRMVPLKGFDIAVESFASFYHSLPAQAQSETSLHLVGKGPYRKQLMQLCEKLNVAEAVQFTDWIERASLGKLYQESTLFLFPSYEGAGMVVAEALSYGLPVVCFDNCGPGAFIDTNCGVKVPLSKQRATNIEKFSDILKVLFQSPDVYKQFSQGAITKFTKTFHWDRKGEVLDALYQEVLYTPSFQASSVLKTA